MTRCLLLSALVLASLVFYGQDWKMADSTTAYQELDYFIGEAKKKISWGNDTSANKYKNTCHRIFYENFEYLVDIRNVTRMIDLEESFYRKFQSDTTVENWWMHAIGSIRLYDYYLLRARLKAKKEDYYGARLDVNNALAEHEDYPTPEGSEGAYYILGLLQLQAGEKSEACKNLSIAGEYGIDRAYDVIAKACN